ncbi:F0F1 ATP synthase subunit delta [Candidatus Kaiserbacteria bacterium]|nr:F0F1 ATP synthase subunit delta [Candidatus Kaiserbacteria bacterium]
MEKAYAQALWNTIAGGMDPKKSVHAVHKILETEGRTELMPRIARAFERLAAREHSRNTVTLTVAHKRDEAQSRQEAAEALKELGADAHTLETYVDDSLIGGWRLEGREHLVDESYKKHLLAIYTAATL